MKGKNTHFICHSPRNITWTHNGGTLPINTKYYRKSGLINVLYITKINQFIAGTYTCSYEADLVVYYDEGLLIVIGMLYYY